MKSFDYKDDILLRYKKYNPIVHSSEEKDYDFLDGDRCCSIEIKNNNDSLFIDLEDEITITYGDWHCHHYYEDQTDYEEAIEQVDNILNNKECHLSIFSNNKWFGSGSISGKEKYTIEDALDFIKSFFDISSLKSFNSDFKEYGVKIEFEFWDKEKDYELIIDKSFFN